MISWLIFFIIAFFCGSIGSQLAGASKKGCIASIVLGLIGAVLGGWLQGRLGMPAFIMIKGIPIIWSVIGSALFVALLNLISGGNKGKG
ncbi:MAG: GlsB/YeaQ/YmgE family stress response membrane protein [bacterium]|nr:GlsB/YeaQ/YmgE family stress response membrane protein [bacterium]